MHFTKDTLKKTLGILLSVCLLLSTFIYTGLNLSETKANTPKDVSSKLSNVKLSIKSINSDGSSSTYFVQDNVNKTSKDLFLVILKIQ